MTSENLPVKDKSNLVKIKDSLQKKISVAFDWLNKEEGKLISNTVASLGSFVIGDPTGMIFPFILESSDLMIRKRLLKHFPDLVKRLENEKHRINDDFVHSERGQELLRETIKELIHQIDEEKVEYHKNLLVNSYIQSDVDEEKISLYWQILISLPPTSLKILRVLLEPNEMIKKIFELKKGEDVGDYFHYSLKPDLAKVMKINQFVFNRSSDELESYGLIDVKGTVQGWAAGRYHEPQYNEYFKRVTSDANRLVTDDGKEFYNYVKSKM